MSSCHLYHCLVHNGLIGKNKNLFDCKVFIMHCDFFLMGLLYLVMDEMYFACLIQQPEFDSDNSIYVEIGSNYMCKQLVLHSGQP